MKTKFKLLALIFALLCMAIIFMPNQVFATDIIEVDTYEKMRDALESGKSVKLMNNVEIPGDTGNSSLKPTRSVGVVIMGTGDITIDGNGHTVSSAADKARTIFEIYAGDEELNVTFKNIIMENAKANGRCINTYTDNINLTLSKTTLKTTSADTNNQPLTIGGNYTNTNTINLIGTSISAGNSGYGIITYNPVNLTISSESTIVGYGALYFKGTEDLNGLTDAAGAAGSVINVSDSTLVGHNEHDGESNSFATIKFEDDNIELNIDGCTIGDPRGGDALQYFMTEEFRGSEIEASTTGNRINVSNSTITMTDGILNLCTEGSKTKVTIGEGVTSTVAVEDYLAEDVVCKVENEKYVTYKKHAIIIDENIANGTVTVNVDKAIVGDIITVTVKANDGYQLKSLKAYTAAEAEIEVVDGKFVMPNLGAIVTAEFEKIPEPEPEPTPETGDVDFIVPEDNEDSSTAIGVVESETVKEILDTSLKADKELNKKVEEAKEKGEDVTVEIKMNTLEKDNVKEEEKQKILQIVTENQKVHQYFDISVLVKASDKELGKITQLTEKMRFSMEISKDLIQEGRKFFILKLHDGEVKKIEATLNGTKLEFETDQFSTFALAYEDVVEETSKDTPTSGDKDETPKTGAINAITYVWMSIVVIAVVGIITTKKPSKHSK